MKNKTIYVLNKFAVWMIVIVFIMMFVYLFYFSFMMLRLEKYIPLDNAMREIAKQQYNEETYNCTNYSADLVSKLKTKGIQAEVVSSNTHAWVGVWFEPQTGDFTPDYGRESNVMISNVKEGGFTVYEP